MQGMHDFVPTTNKIEYINRILKCGFDTVDFGSFVSPKAIPQMKDTEEVLAGLDLSTTDSKLLAIVANLRGAQTAVAFEEIAYLGFPFSISETFQQRNTNSSLEQSLIRVDEIQSLCTKNDKELIVYLSMAFGNPYGDPWDVDVAANWTDRLSDEFDINCFALSDTIGSSTPETIEYMFGGIISEFKSLEIGAHLHSTPETIKEKLEAAYKAGCRRFDGAIKGLGGCPMAADELTGNMATEVMLEYFGEHDIKTNINLDAFEKAKTYAQEIF